MSRPGALHVIDRRQLARVLAGAGAAMGVPAAASSREAAPAASRKSGVAIRAAADALLAGAGPACRAKLTFPFGAPERHGWRYVPGVRPGLDLGEMTNAERTLALALLAASLGRAGYAKATGVIRLADVLRVTRGWGRGSGAYAFAVFGDPSHAGPWGWRVEGHHLSLNFTLIGEEVVSTTPHCVCADPDEVMEGPLTGLRPLDREDYIARDLAGSFDAAQMAMARRAGDVPSDVQAGPGRASALDAPGGIGFAALTDETQHHLMFGVAECYVGNLPYDLATALMRKIAADHDRLRFQWAGGLERSDLRYYRMTGPGLLIEYSTRERANHIHTLWREPGNDFGRGSLMAAGLGPLPPSDA
jgi:hypothetical protein